VATGGAGIGWGRFAHSGDAVAELGARRKWQIDNALSSIHHDSVGDSKHRNHGAMTGAVALALSPKRWGPTLRVGQTESIG
jgi:hypothetical protein